MKALRYMMTALAAAVPCRLEPISDPLPSFVVA